MILVDTSIWIDHLRSKNSTLHGLLEARLVLGHPFVAGELALGQFRQSHRILAAIQTLPQAIVARHDEVIEMISRNALAGSGIGYVDAHLLAAVRLFAGTRLWTRDKRLEAVAERLGLGSNPLH